MPIVYIIARDWPLRAMVRAELRERGIATVGMTGASETGRRIAGGEMPSAVVMESCAGVDPGLESLAERVPFVVVASNSPRETWPQAAARVLHRPVRIAEVVAAVLELLRPENA